MKKYAVTIHLVANSLEEVQKLDEQYGYRGSVEYQELQPTWEEVYDGYVDN